MPDGRLVGPKVIKARTLGQKNTKMGLEDQKWTGKCQNMDLEAPKGQNRRRDHVDSPTTGDRHGNLCGRSVVGSES